MEVRKKEWVDNLIDLQKKVSDKTSSNENGDVFDLIEGLSKQIHSSLNVRDGSISRMDVFKLIESIKS